MTKEPSIITKLETRLGYEILVTTIGPVKTKPDEPENLQTHHKAKISIWFNGREEASEAPSMLFVSREDAAEFGLDIGRMMVAQRRKSIALQLIDRACELFKLRQGREAGGL